jgi:phosphoglycerol transferase MdoB-like AlkP superfamily enzyme
VIEPVGRVQPAASPWRELAADVVLWLVLVALLVGFRAFLIGYFRERIGPEAGAAGVLRCFRLALAFDVSIATYALLPSLILTVLGFFVPMRVWPGRVRRGLTALVLVLCAVAFATDTPFIAEYNDQFNHWIFGMVYDDRRAILLTVWHTYPVVTGLLVGAILTAGAIWAVTRLWQAASARMPVPGRPATVWGRVLAVVLILAVAFAGLRGSLGRRPIQIKDAAVTGDAFLNRLVPNPFRALRAAIADHRKLQSERGIEQFVPDRNIRAAAQAVYPGARDAADLDAALMRTAPGPMGAKPAHVFVVVMESLDSWSRQPPYSELRLTEGLNALAREGIEAGAFVPAGDGTMKSLGAILCGLPYAGVFVNYQPQVRAGVPTAPAPIFKSLGYRTRFFYGGYLSWQRLGEFCREQGFEEIYGGDRMAARLSGDEWGIPDEALFDFILAHTGSEPTFNVIMSTSYHPPFSVDVEARGFDVAARQAHPLCRDLTREQLRILGHLWYSDQALTRFVTAAQQKLERPLFAITGDHMSRRLFVETRPPLFASVAVPFVLSGREVLAGVPRPAQPLAGSHNDILPTLIEWVAPAGFRYAAFGRNLLAAGREQVGFGCGVVMGPGFVVNAFDPGRTEDLKGGPGPAEVSGPTLALRYRQIHALAWWRAMQGPAWPPETGH